jgi:hypothetical protein
LRLFPEPAQGAVYIGSGVYNFVTTNPGPIWLGFFYARKQKGKREMKIYACCKSCFKVATIYIDSGDKEASNKPCFHCGQNTSLATWLENKTASRFGKYYDPTSKERK